MQAINKGIPELKDLCALVIAEHINKQFLPKIDSYKNLKKAYARLDNIPLFKKLVSIQYF